MAKSELRRELQSAIYLAKQQNLPVKREGLQIREGERFRQVTINVTPFQMGASQECFLILFEETPLILELPAASDDGSTPTKRKTREAAEIARLKHELASKSSLDWGYLTLKLVKYLVNIETNLIASYG